MADFKDLDCKVVKLSKQMINMCTASGSGHPSSALSLAHITVALMYRIMRYDPQRPLEQCRRSPWYSPKATPFQPFTQPIVTSVGSWANKISPPNYVSMTP